ncbi:PREDICTED: small integral membrane protein 14 [Polistes dominula]|uniref:Small integral membrane protein 14 n=1 Tax=Polistes dominula TaxID=743375 RepID=A0ABM1JF50_POLDO|nr:PREDICTED: small integral membrane protein 14 [Polistes dominula]XP_015191088.1 PREDICTED: small integral membrane protein 14 [Polistes dominula]XP_015191090.1 PREDICTED: small integral membrane protein 14 [Polistes dominula]
MSDNSDPCEYFWSHEFLVQRLLYILRQSQDHCSDIECYSLSRLPGPPPVESTSSDFFLTGLFLAFVLVMYITGPRIFQNQQFGFLTKNRDNISDMDDDLPPPPPAGN